MINWGKSMRQRDYKIFKYAYIKVIITMILLISPINILLIMQYRNTTDFLVKQAEFITQNLADNAMNELNTKMENAYDILNHFLQEDADCIRMRKQEEGYKYDSAKMKTYYNLKTMGSMINGGDGYFYYMRQKKDILLWGQSAPRINVMEIMTDFLLNEVHQKWKSGWHIYNISNQQYLVLMVDKKDIIYGSWIRLDTIIRNTEQSLEYDNYSVSISDTVEENTKQNILVVSSEKQGIVMNIRLTRNDIIAVVSEYQKIINAASLIYILLIPVLYLFLRKLLLQPLREVLEAHRQLRNGHSEYRITAKNSSVEFQEVYDSFNSMADDLIRFKINNYEKEIARQKMELRNLQLQIRPHFLLNTFNLISVLAQRGEIDPIQDITLYLSDYFRYIFRSNKDLELLSKELELIKMYVKMASIRYYGRVELQIDIEPELNFVRIPPLLIHNFVENAVKHGIKNEGILHISIIGEYEERIVNIYIIDDGNGMTKDQLKEELLVINGLKKIESSNHHVGLMNAIKRIRYFYGDTSQLDIESEEGKMTSIRVQFPYNLEE